MGSLVAACQILSGCGVGCPAVDVHACSESVVSRRTACGSVGGQSMVPGPRRLWGPAAAEAGEGRRQVRLPSGSCRGSQVRWRTQRARPVQRPEPFCSP